MRIGFDFRLGGIKHGGIGRYSFELISHLLEFAPKDEFFIFFNPKNFDTNELVTLAKFKNAKLIEADARHYSIKEQITLPKLLSETKLQLMHFPNFNVPVFYKKPFVMTIHDVVHHKLSGHKKSRLLYYYGYKYVIENAAKRARKIITVSESSKKDIMSTLAVPSEKIVVTYQGVNRQEVEISLVDKVRERFLLPRPYFLFTGVLERKKNIPQLTRAFDIFIEKYKLDIDLVIAGRRDPHYPEIRNQALSVKNKHRIVFTGFVTDSELQALYSGAYAFVTASLFEGFGLPALEAMAYGLPVLASNTETFNEVYDNAALYFDATNAEDIADKMYLLARDPLFYEQCQQKSITRAGLFNWEDTAKQTYQIYKESILG